MEVPPETAVSFCGFPAPSVEPIRSARIRPCSPHPEEQAKAAGTFDDATLKTMRDLEHQQWVHLFGPDSLE
jgi:hypothetical protein